MPAPETDIRALILDMDGVLWRGEEPLGDLPANFRTIESCGWPVILVTNNATRSLDSYADKLRRFGVRVETQRILNSTHAMGAYLQRQYPEGGRIYLIGEDGARETLQEYGFSTGEEDVLAVVVSLDRHLTYDSLEQAAYLIQGGVPFLATNPDRSLPTPRGLAPGTGAIVAAVQAATDVEPTVVGKPAPELFQQAFERLSCEPAQTLVVGDRLETDIAGGQRAGARTAVVLTGVATEEQARAWQPPPDYIAPDLTRLLARVARQVTG